MALLILLAGCAKVRPASLGIGTVSPTPCEQLIPDCHAQRLPDLFLSEDTPAPDGTQALGSVSGPTDGVIGFDQALIRAWAEDGNRDAKTVQVVLGSADGEAMHWQTSHTLFYGITWGRVTECPAGGNPHASGPPPCVIGVAGTIIDALTGDFIVGGFGPAHSP
jgi:hypothetical protein